MDTVNIWDLEPIDYSKSIVDDALYARMKRELELFDYERNITIDDGNNVVAGWPTVTLLRAIGVTAIEVERVTLTEQQKEFIRFAAARKLRTAEYLAKQHQTHTRGSQC